MLGWLSGKAMNKQKFTECILLLCNFACIMHMYCACSWDTLEDAHHWVFKYVKLTMYLCKYLVVKEDEGVYSKGGISKRPWQVPLLPVTIPEPYTQQLTTISEKTAVNTSNSVSLQSKLSCIESNVWKLVGASSVSLFGFRLFIRACGNELWIGVGSLLVSPNGPNPHS